MHVEFDLVERNVAGAFDHDLHAATPGAFGEFAEGFEFGELGGVGRVGEAAGAEAVADGEGHVVATEDVADHRPSACTSMFSALWTSIHLASSEPPRETMPMRRLRTSGRCAFCTPAWMVK